MDNRTINILVTGATGLLGRAIIKHFENETNSAVPEEKCQYKWNVIGTYNTRVRRGLKKLDLTKFDDVEKFIDEFKPDAIIHCAAEKKVENVEKDYKASSDLNIGATENLAKICSGKKYIKFIYISTDYVFDGTAPPYTPNCKPNPLNKYAVTKLEGEEVTLNADERHCIVRVPVLYGHTEKDGHHESAVNVLVNNVKKGQECMVDDVLLRFPTHIIDVARFCERLLITYFDDVKSNSVQGIFHCSANEKFTKFEMSCHIAEALNLCKNHLKRDLSAADSITSGSARPKNPKLCTESSYNVIKFQHIMKFIDSIKDCLENHIEAE